MLSFRRFAPVLAVSLAFLIPPGLAAVAAPGSADAGNTNAAPASHGYLPLHPDYPQVKAQADAIAQAKAQGSGATVKGGHGGGGGTGPSTTNPDLGWEGVYQTTVTPPDSTGAAGPTSYVELVNDKYGIYPTTGTPLSGPLSTLFADTKISNGALSDPQILWDPATSRFYYVAIDTTSGNYALLYGFTKTSNPMDGFCSYRALSYGSTLPDYPKLGDMAGYLLVGVNDFANAATYTGSEVAWITKQATDVTTTDSCPGVGTGRIQLTVNATPVPAVQADTASTSGYVVQAADVSGSSSTPKNQLIVTSITPATTPPSFTTTQKDVTVDPYYLPSNAPQYGTSKRLDTLDGRFEHAVEVGGVVYTAHAVAEASGGMSVERWYAIDPGTVTGLAAEGTLGDSSLYVFNGAISPDLSGGNLVLGASTSGANAYPAMQAVQWAATDATPLKLVPASASIPGSVIEQSQTYNYDFSCSGRQSVCRWGDYSGASPDPLGGGVFLSNQYNVGGGSIFQAAWRTRNIRIATP